MKLVAYFRVSTDRQGRSGLGLEAQRASVEAYAARTGGRVLASYTEVESGRRNDRPALARALSHARATGATLVVAKLDRLSRNAAFLLALRDSGAKLAAADLPSFDRIMVAFLAIAAEHEAEAISRRTADALRALKARGVRLGNPNGAAALRRAGKGNSAAVEAVRARAQATAGNLREIVREVRETGAVSLGAMADALNAREVETPRGGRWHKSQVRNLLARLEAAQG